MIERGHVGRIRRIRRIAHLNMARGLPRCEIWTRLTAACGQQHASPQRNLTVRSTQSRDAPEHGWGANARAIKAGHQL